MPMHQQQYNLQKTILTWFNQKLKDQPPAESLPELCVDQSPVNHFADLKPVTSYDLKKTWIAPTATQAVFIPIHTALQPTSITGSALLSLNMETTHEDADATLFISMAIKSKITGKYTVLNDQAAPFNPAKKASHDQIRLGLMAQNSKTPSIELPSVYGQLNEGDTLGVLINSESLYYQKIQQPKIEAWISGQIVLPKLWQVTAVN